MKKQKILILKNDRGGDLFTSINLISSLLNENTFIVTANPRRGRSNLSAMQWNRLQSLHCVYSNCACSHMILSLKGFYNLRQELVGGSTIQDPVVESQR